MNRTDSGEDGLQIGVPRASGDEPQPVATLQWEVVCSPRERG